MKKINFPKITLLGWNENTCNCLTGLIKEGMFPQLVIVPEGYDFKELKSICDSNNLSLVKVKMKDSISSVVKNHEMLISASWPFYIHPKDSTLFSLGAINVHASLLPQYRGYHPLNWALINDEDKIGVTVHFINEGIDRGDILLQEEFRVLDSDTLISIRNKVHNIGARLLVQSVKAILSAEAKPTLQDESQATYAPRRRPEDGRINWNKSAREIFCLIRGVSHPAPGAFSMIGSKKIIIWNSKVDIGMTKAGLPGVIIDEKNGQLWIRTGGNGILKVLEYSCKEARTKIGQVLS